jgi:hypothetical protein
MAIASGVGASIVLPAEAADLPSAGLFGERGGRALVAVRPAAGERVRAAADAVQVAALRLGVASGDLLDLAVGETRVTTTLGELQAAWDTPFEVG